MSDEVYFHVCIVVNKENFCFWVSELILLNKTPLDSMKCDYMVWRFNVWFLGSYFYEKTMKHMLCRNVELIKNACSLVTTVKSTRS